MAGSLWFEIGRGAGSSVNVGPSVPDYTTSHPRIQ
jgi:hypothetical protein